MKKKYAFADAMPYYLTVCPEGSKFGGTPPNAKQIIAEVFEVLQRHDILTNGRIDIRLWSIEKKQDEKNENPDR